MILLNPFNFFALIIKVSVFESFLLEFLQQGFINVLLFGQVYSSWLCSMFWTLFFSCQFLYSVTFLEFSINKGYSFYFLLLGDISYQLIFTTCLLLIQFFSTTWLKDWIQNWQQTIYVLIHKSMSLLNHLVLKFWSLKPSVCTRLGDLHLPCPFLIV